MLKEFRVAEIVPVECLPKTKENQYHMCLANLVVKSEEYTEFYKARAAEGKFVLMDNGAAEGDQLGLKELIECYEKVQPTEIVLPDTLCDSKDTVYKSTEAFNILKINGLLKNRRIMFVPQGKSFGEWNECLEEFISLVGLRSIDTIGVSKFLEMETGDSEIRVRAVKFLKEFYPWYEVHLLGCSEGPEIVKKCHEASDRVRGCDSAFVYICTQAGVRIEADTKRPEGEINFLEGCDFVALEENMKSFERAVGVEDNGISESWR